MKHMGTPPPKSVPSALVSQLPALGSSAPRGACHPDAFSPPSPAATGRPSPHSLPRKLSQPHLHVYEVACSLAPATREVKVSCWEDVDLPCTAPWDPHVPYVASWTKFKEDSEESVEIPQEDLHLGGQHSHQQGQNGSSEAPRERPYSLKIRNTTSCNSGTYKCTLQELHGLRNLSGTVILQVTGCPTGRKEANFQKYRAEIVLLLALVVFYLTLIIFTCKFARLQSIFPDFSKPGMEQAFLPVTFPGKHLGPVTLQKTEVV
uniref:CD83 antigen n=1 Tax=Oryctolagus cuniculus TaxID=9986 RepID=A0A5F9DIU0_RABIT